MISLKTLAICSEHISTSNSRTTLRPWSADEAIQSDNFSQVHIKAPVYLCYIRGAYIIISMLYDQAYKLCNFSTQNASVKQHTDERLQMWLKKPL